jgi:hypothetical protein
MKPLKHSDWIAISGFFLVITFLSLWAIDISVSALLSGGYLTNGFFNSNPTMIYHIGLYIISLTCFSNFLVIIHLIFRSRQEKTEKESSSVSKILDADATVKDA